MDAPGSAGIGGQTSAQRLREVGLRVTQARLKVLHVLADRGGHLSADDIVAELCERGTPLPRASVYGVVAALLTHGLLMLTDIGPGRALYELQIDGTTILSAAPAGRFKTYLASEKNTRV